MMNDEHDINIVNSEVKTFLTERFQTQIQFCPSEGQMNQFLFFHHLLIYNMLCKNCARLV